MEYLFLDQTRKVDTEKALRLQLELILELSMAKGKALAAMFGVGKSTVEKIINNKRYVK